VAAILTGAAQVLERRGYAGTTTDAIAERAGVSVGSVYQYFPNKEAILVALAERHIEEGFERVWGLLEEARGRELALETLMRRFVEAMIALHRNEPRLHRVLFEEAPLPAGLRRRLQRLEDAFAEQVAMQLAEWPGLRPQSPTPTA
jgi:AcrR family transcriptional regulator